MTRNVNKKGDLKITNIDGACNSTSEDMLKLSTITISTVPDCLSRLGSPCTRSMNATVIPKNSVSDWNLVNKVKEVRASPSKELNIVVKSAGNLA